MPEKKEKYNKLFNDDDDEEEKPKFTPKKSVEPSNKQSSPPIESDPHIKPILKYKHDDEDNQIPKKKIETKLRAKFDDEEDENQIKQKKEEDDNIFGKKKNDPKIKTKFDDELNEEDDIFGKKITKKNEEEIKQKPKVVFDETKNMTQIEDKPKGFNDEPKKIPKIEDNLFGISKNTTTNESKPLPSLGDPLKTKIKAKFEDNEPEEDIFGKKSIKNEEKTKQTILNESKPLPSLGEPLKPKIKSNFDEEPEENIFGKKSLNKSEKQTIVNESKLLPSLGDPIKTKIKANFDEEPEENIFGKKSLDTREHDEKIKKTIFSESKPLPSLGDPIPSKIKNNFDEPNEAPLFKQKNQESPIKEQQKPIFPPKNSPEKIEKVEQIIDNKPKEEEPALNKKPTRTLNAKMMDLQAKLGGLPMGLPNERISMNPRKNLKKDEKVELDNDILLDKPIISRKKKPRGQKAANFENENDEILQFERKAQPIQPESQQSEKEIHAAIETSIQIGLERPSEKNLKGIDQTSEKKLDRPSEFKTDRPSKKPDLLFEDSQENLFNVRKEVSIKKENSIQKPNLPDIFGDPLVSKSSKHHDRPSEKNPLDRPSERNPLEKPSDKNPLGVSGKKTGLFMESSESIPENKGPSLPSLGDSKPLPVISDEKEDKKKKKHHHKKEKKDIFEDDEEEKVEKKMPEFKAPVIESKPSKNNLPDFKGPGLVPKPGEKQSKKLKKLFDDDDDDGSFLFKPGGR